MFFLLDSVDVGWEVELSKNEKGSEWSVIVRNYSFLLEGPFPWPIGHFCGRNKALIQVISHSLYLLSESQTFPTV